MRSLKFESPSQFSATKPAQALVLEDNSGTEDSEAMNSRNEPRRVSVTKRHVNLNGRPLDYNFAPLSVALVEVKPP